MQNTVIKELGDHPDVVTILFNQGVVFNENWHWLRTFWDNYYLRGGVVHDSTWVVADEYLQPNTNLPFGRGFIIDRDGTVALPYFSHNPRLVIETIEGMLAGTGVSDGDAGQTAGVARVRLASPMPNPFNPTTTIGFAILSDADVVLSVFDIAGRRVKELAHGRRDAGEHAVVWDGTTDTGAAAASGVYFVRIEALGERDVRKAVLLK